VGFDVLYASSFVSIYRQRAQHIVVSSLVVAAYLSGLTSIGCGAAQTDQEASQSQADGLALTNYFSVAKSKLLKSEELAIFQQRFVAQHGCNDFDVTQLSSQMVADEPEPDFEDAHLLSLRVQCNDNTHWIVRATAFARTTRLNPWGYNEDDVVLDHFSAEVVLYDAPKEGAPALIADYIVYAFDDESLVRIEGTNASELNELMNAIQALDQEQATFDSCLECRIAAWQTNVGQTYGQVWRFGKRFVASGVGLASAGGLLGYFGSYVAGEVIIATGIYGVAVTAGVAVVIAVTAPLYFTLKAVVARNWAKFTQGGDTLAGLNECVYSCGIRQD